MPPMHWYTDWNFWTAIIALLALILSQLQPLHLLFRSAKLEMELYSRIHIHHKVGNPQIQMHLIIINVGGKDLRIKGITAKVKRDSKDLVDLPAQNYLVQP